LIDLAARVLRIDREKIEPEHSLIALGIDSLMAVELKNRIELALTVTPAVVDLLRGLTIRELAARLLAQIEAANPDTAEPATEELTDAERELAEADPELLKELMATLIPANGDLQRPAIVMH
jgi:acyl carrier protein